MLRFAHVYQRRFALAMSAPRAAILCPILYCQSFEHSPPPMAPSIQGRLLPLAPVAFRMAYCILQK